MDRRSFLVGAAATAGALLLPGCSAESTKDAGRLQTMSAAQLAALKGMISGRVLTANDPEYLQYCKPRNGRYRGNLPTAVVVCATEEDISKSVGFAHENGVDFAARSGGHNYAGYSTTNGLLISMAAMKQLKLDSKTGIATVAPGVQNRDIRAALGGGPWLVSGGTCPTVGISGLLLGGGIGPNTRWAGLTCDSLLGTTAVTADGRDVVADAQSHQDLFWACKGAAGGNFGLNSSFKMQLERVPAKRVLTFAFEFVGRDQLTKALQAWNKIMATAPNTFSGLFTTNSVVPKSASPRPSVQGSGPTSAKSAADVLDVEGLLFGQYIGPEDEGRDLLAPMLKLQAADSLIMRRNWWDANDYLLGPEEDADRSFWDRSYFFDGAYSDDATARLVETLGEYPGGAGEQYGELIFYGWIGGRMNEPRPESTAFVHRTNSGLFRLSAVWPYDASNDAASSVPGPMKDWMAKMSDVAAPASAGTAYQNFPDPELADWKQAYYGDNLARLSQVKRTYDPTNTFNYGQSIPVG